MTSMAMEPRARLEVLERQFAVTTVVFKKFGPIFLSVFRSPGDNTGNSSDANYCLTLLNHVGHDL